MPELPDVVVYVEHLARLLGGATLLRARVMSPNLLRTAFPSLREAEGKRVRGVSRRGKRIVLELDTGLLLAFHLMIAGRLHWARAGATKSHAKRASATLEFTSGTLVLTEAGSMKRAALHVLAGLEALGELDAGGLEVLEASRADFARTLARENHTLKRVLTDPRLFSGIGNAYSDEILHRARLSPLGLTRRLDDSEIERLFIAARDTLLEWTARLREAAGDRFPENVTAFRKEMAVHGRYRQPCPDCGAPVQRIVHAENETNYCARCQTGGKLLADRSLSRLLKRDWPRTLEELETSRRA